MHSVGQPAATGEWLVGGGEMGALIRAKDWSETSIGPRESWSPALRMMVSFLVANRFPMLLWWGPEYVSIYNDPYRPVLGTKHPWGLGRPVSECWSEIWHILKPLIDTPFNGGPATWNDDIALEINRHGFMEETHFTIAYSPVPDATVATGIGGVLATVTETTEKVVGERRIRVLRDLGYRAAEARTTEEACAIAAGTLAKHSQDVPFALIYLVEATGRQARLAGGAGIGRDETFSPPVVDLHGANQQGGWPLAAAMQQPQLQVIEDLGSRFADVPAGPWTDPPHTAVILPIPSNLPGEVAGLLVTGISSRLRFDEHYCDFLELMKTQIATVIANSRAYEEAQKRAEALAEIDRAKTTFFSNVSHEFRTPLTLMLGPLEELKKEFGSSPDSLSGSQYQQVDLVHRSGLRLLKLVNTLLDFSRIEAGRMQALYQPTDLAAFTAEIASVFRSAMDKAGLRFVIDCPALTEQALVDREMWEKIVLNLVSNAFKFTFDGEIAVKLRIVGDNFELTIRDTGTGIPQDEVPKLFERFHRVAGAQGRTHEGSGIGLALVQELARLHGGLVTAESRFGRGSTFRVLVPTGSRHLPASQIGAARTQVPTAVGAGPFIEEALRWLPDAESSGTGDGNRVLDAANVRSSERTRILLADDNADMRAYVQRILNPLYEVEAVADGEAALAAIGRRRPDLVVSDVMMPRLDGIEMVARLRADERTRTLPIILLSARAGEEAKEQGLARGADEYLVKPFSARELLTRVSAAIELSRMRSQSERFLQEEAQILTLLNKVGAAVAAELDLERTVQVVTDAATELSGASFGSFFYNVTDAKGESYTLYTLSGAPRSAFARFPMPRNTAVFGPTFSGEGVVRSDDITKDARYGQNSPYRGMPEGHLPVRSYLAAPVISRSGEVLGGLFFGHPEVGIFSERAERIVSAIAVQAGIAIDKAKLYRAAQAEIARRQQIEARLREGEQTLERRVAERTAQWIAASQERERAEGNFRLLVEGVVDYAIYMLDPTGIITSWNAGGERIKGYRSDEVVGEHYSRFFTPEDRNRHLPENALEVAARDGKYEGEGWRIRKDGSRFWASVVLDAIRDPSGRLIGFAKITRDTTERREATIALQKSQEQLAQAQKMEGIGHLTGGVAHDFNNLLTIIMGNLETLRRVARDPKADPSRLNRSIENAMLGAERAAALTQRLLAFSRQQPLEPRVLEVNRLIAGMSDLLRRSLGEDVAIETVLAGGLWRVHVDPNQLEVALLNLAINARDAMQDGGKLTIETANASLDEHYAASQAEVVAGQYVAICVTDTGSGMTPDVIERAFEPFFTTKDVGHGTGLGLSQVYGFVKQSGGHVKIYSEVNQGTTIKIYLPRLHAAEIATPPPKPAPPLARGQASETILVVEDDPDVRNHTKAVLGELGYRTFEAGTGRAALQLLKTHPEIKLLFTDVGLPGGMNGRELADDARRLNADLKVLMTTGYARNAIVHDGKLDPGVQLITKPFTYAALAAKVRSILDAPPRSGRILLVEDEPLIRMAAVEQLEALGFKVETAGSAADAMSKLKLVGDVEAAIIDVGLPDPTGDVLVSEVRVIYPKMPIIIASGYNAPELREKFKTDTLVAFLGKPYTEAQLRSVLSSLNVGGLSAA